MTEIANIFNSSIGFFISMIIGMIATIIPTIKILGESNWRKRFDEQLAAAIARDSLELEDIVHLAER